MPVMRAKVSVVSVEITELGEILNMIPVTNGTAEDNTYSKLTPSGSIRLAITNESLFGKFKPGDKYYVDFIKEIPEQVPGIV